MAIPSQHSHFFLSIVFLWTLSAAKGYISVCESHSTSIYCHCNAASYKQPSPLYKVDCIVLTNITKDDPIWRSIGDSDKISSLKVHPMLPLKLDYIPSEEFRRMPNLKILKIQEGSLGTLSPYYLSGLNALEELELKGNEISALEPNAISNMPMLRILTLSENSLQELLADSLNDLLGLENLYLDNNNISRIETCAFCNLHNLKVLELVGNQLSDLTEYTFRGLRYLTRLDLYRNKIRILNDKVFHNMERLVELSLRENLISHISARAFVGLEKLRHLSLANNKIKLLPNEVFVPLVSVYHVDLFYNEIEVIQKEVVQSIKNFKNVHFTFAFRANPLVCDCDWNWVANYLKDNQSYGVTQELRKVKCKSENDTEVLIVDYLNEMDCKTSTIKPRTPVMAPVMVTQSTESAPIELNSQKSKPLLATAEVQDHDETETFLSDVGREASVEDSGTIVNRPCLALYLFAVIVYFVKTGMQL